MPSNTVCVEMSKLPQDFMLHAELHIAQRFWFRLWVAKQLICLAAWVLGCGIEVEDNEGADEW